MIWPFKRKAVVEPTPDGEGCLFGLSPPEGCHFHVSLHVGTSWHVRIVRDGKNVAHECSLIGSGKRTDEDLIREAAKDALRSFKQATSSAHLEGCYPPKWVARG